MATVQELEARKVRGQAIAQVESNVRRLDATEYSFGYHTVKPTAIWGNIPLGLIDDSPKRNPEPDMFARGPRNPAARAEMPLGLSQAILEAVEPRKTTSEQSAGAATA